MSCYASLSVLALPLLASASFSSSATTNAHTTTQLEFEYRCVNHVQYALENRYSYTHNLNSMNNNTDFAESTQKYASLAAARLGRQRNINYYNSRETASSRTEQQQHTFDGKFVFDPVKLNAVLTILNNIALASASFTPPDTADSKQQFSSAGRLAFLPVSQRLFGRFDVALKSESLCYLNSDSRRNVCYREYLTRLSQRFLCADNFDPEMILNLPPFVHSEDYYRCLLGIFALNCEFCFTNPVTENLLSEENSTAALFSFTEDGRTECEVEGRAPNTEIVTAMYVYVFPIIIIIGLVTNILSFIVLTRPWMRGTSINTYLLGLAVFDMTMLIFSLFLYPPMGKCISNGGLGKACVFLQVSMFGFYPLSNIAQTASVWACVAIAVDRAIAVVYPLKARSVCTFTRARVILVIITAFALAFRAPMFFEHRLNSTTREFERTELRSNPLYLQIYSVYLQLLIMFLIPLCIMIVLNVCIIYTLNSAKATRVSICSNQNPREEREYRLSLLVICVVVAFAILNILPLAVNIYEGITAKIPAPWELICVSNLCVLLNATVNFFIYMSVGQKFRQTFIALFSSRRMSYMTPQPTHDRRYSTASKLSANNNEQAGIISIRKLPPDSTSPPAYRTNNGDNLDVKPNSVVKSNFDYTPLRASVRRKVDPHDTDGVEMTDYTSEKRRGPKR